MNRGFLRHTSAALILLGAIAAACAASATHNDHRLTLNFNRGWLFAAGDIANGQAVALNESSFQTVCLPHTTARVKHRDIDRSSFEKITWYRRHFAPPAGLAGKYFSIEFQAVSKAATVYLNGQLLGEHKGGYTPFAFDISNKVRIGRDNVLAVRVDSRTRRDIPPEGTGIDYFVFGGIVRDVKLTVADPLHVSWVYAVRDSTRPDCIKVRTLVTNGGAVRKPCTLATLVADSAGAITASKEASAAIAPNDSFEFSLCLGPIPRLRLWHPDHPYLYTVLTQLQIGKDRVDDDSLKFGVRTLAFSKTTGVFSVNGSPMKLRGLNRHETFPFIGRAASDRLQARDADIIKYDFGCNIVRCSHYPQAPAFLDRCDAIGLLVLEEMPGWLYVGDAAWRDVALHTLDEMVMRDRNHPSVVSFGVRINESLDFHDFYRRTNTLVRTLDPSRPTHGVRVAGRGSPHEFMEDLWGQNFAIPAKTPFPLPWITTESVGHRFATHAWDGNDRLVNQMRAFAAVNDSAAANPGMAGLLGWCAFDYNSPHFTAEKSVDYHGVADIFRLPKHAAFFYRSQADPALYGPMIYIADYWQESAAPRDIWVACNCDRAELLVNGVSLGRRSPDRYGSLPHPLFVWRAVKFRPGTLTAVGYIGNAIAATAIRITPGPPRALRMVADDTLLDEGGDMTRVVVTAVDGNGRTVPQAKNLVDLSLSGPADLEGESPIALEDGKTAFFVKTRADEPGTVVCRARGAGLGEAQTRIRVAVAPRGTIVF
jgi:beta-galactosidase